MIYHTSGEQCGKCCSLETFSLLLFGENYVLENCPTSSIMLTDTLSGNCELAGLGVACDVRQILISACRRHPIDWRGGDGPHNPQRKGCCYVLAIIAGLLPSTAFPALLLAAELQMGPHILRMRSFSACRRHLLRYRMLHPTQGPHSPHLTHYQWSWDGYCTAWFEDVPRRSVDKFIDSDAKIRTVQLPTEEFHQSYHFGRTAEGWGLGTSCYPDMLRGRCGSAAPQLCCILGNVACDHCDIFSACRRHDGLQPMFLVQSEAQQADLNGVDTNGSPTAAAPMAPPCCSTSLMLSTEAGLRCPFLDALLLIADVLEVFFRTAALMMLISCLRLLAYAIPLKGGANNADPLIRGARRALRPAPVALVFMVFICPVQSMDAEMWNEIQMMDLRIQLETSAQEGSNACEFVGDPIFPDYFRDTINEADVFGVLPDDDLPDDWGALEEHEPWQAGVAIHHIQFENTYLTVDVRTDDNEHSITSLLLEALFEEYDDRLLYPGKPQPDDDLIHYLATSTWVMGMGYVPVLIDNSSYNGTRFMKNLRSPATVSDIRRALGSDWRPGSRIWNGSEHLVDGEVHVIFTGMLLLILPWDEFPPVCSTLNERLQEPETWARDVQTHGMPTTVTEANSIALLGYQAQGRIIGFSADLTQRRFRDFLLCICEVHPDGVRVVSSAGHPDGYEVRGRRIPCIRALQSVEHENWRGVFIDPRDLGQEVRFAVVLESDTTLDVFCNLAGIRLPAGWRVHVEGAYSYQASTRSIIVGQCAFLRLMVVPFDSGPGDNDPDTSDFGSEPDPDDADAHSDGSDRPPTDRSRSPRGDRGHRGRPGGGGQTDHTGAGVAASTHVLLRADGSVAADDGASRNSRGVDSDAPATGPFTGSPAPPPLVLMPAGFRQRGILTTTLVEGVPPALVPAYVIRMLAPMKALGTLRKSAVEARCLMTPVCPTMDFGISMQCFT